MKPNTTEAMTQAMNDCITAERFEAAVGYPPKDDDLDRSNCLDAGKIAHQHCGWCLGHDKPRFICGCALRRAPEPKCTCTGHYGDLCLLHQFAKPAEVWLPCSQPPKEPGIFRFRDTKHGITADTERCKWSGEHWLYDRCENDDAFVRMRREMIANGEYLAEGKNAAVDCSGSSHSARERGGITERPNQPASAHLISGRTLGTSAPAHCNQPLTLAAEIAALKQWHRHFVGEYSSPARPLGWREPT